MTSAQRVCVDIFGNFIKCATWIAFWCSYECRHSASETISRRALTEPATKDPKPCSAMTKWRARIFVWSIYFENALKSLSLLPFCEKKSPLFIIGDLKNAHCLELSIVLKKYRLNYQYCRELTNKCYENLNHNEALSERGNYEIYEISQWNTKLSRMIWKSSHCNSSKFHILILCASRLSSAMEKLNSFSEINIFVLAIVISKWLMPLTLRFHQISMSCFQREGNNEQ